MCQINAPPPLLLILPPTPCTEIDDLNKHSNTKISVNKYEKIMACKKYEKKDPYIGSIVH